MSVSLHPSRISTSWLSATAVAALLAALAAAPAAAVDGAPDPKFNGNGRATIDVGEDARLRAVAVQPDGKVVAVGHAKVPTPQDPFNHAFVIVRWNADGTPDTTFGILDTGIVTVDFDLGAPEWGTDGATSVALQPDGNIVVAGYARPSGTEMVAAVARLLPSGFLDPTFGGGDGKATFPELGFTYPLSVRARRNGKILLTPTHHLGANVLLQLTNEGERDPSFGFEGQTETWDCGATDCGHFVEALEMPDDTLMALGQASNEVVVARFLGESGGPGELDMGFGDGGIASFAPAGFPAISYLGAALDHDGRIVVLIHEPNAPSHSALLRLRGDQLDASFGNGGWAELTFTPPTGGIDGHAAALLLQSDGKPVIAGTARVDGNWDFTLTRRTADGNAADASFSGGWRTIGFNGSEGLTDYVNALASSGGRIVAAGGAQTFSGALFAAARLDNALVSTDGFESGSTWFWETSP